MQGLLEHGADPNANDPVRTPRAGRRAARGGAGRRITHNAGEKRKDLKKKMRSVPLVALLSQLGETPYSLTRSSHNQALRRLVLAYGGAPPAGVGVEIIFRDELVASVVAARSVEYGAAREAALLAVVSAAFEAAARDPALLPASSGPGAVVERIRALRDVGRRGLGTLWGRAMAAADTQRVAAAPVGNAPPLRCGALRSRLGARVAVRCAERAALEAQDLMVKALRFAQAARAPVVSERARRPAAARRRGRSATAAAAAAAAAATAAAAAAAGLGGLGTPQPEGAAGAVMVSPPLAAGKTGTADAALAANVSSGGPRKRRSRRLASSNPFASPWDDTDAPPEAAATVVAAAGVAAAEEEEQAPAAAIAGDAQLQEDLLAASAEEALQLVGGGGGRGRASRKRKRQPALQSPAAHRRAAALEAAAAVPMPCEEDLPPDAACGGAVVIGSGGRGGGAAAGVAKMTNTPASAADAAVLLSAPRSTTTAASAGAAAGRSNNPPSSSADVAAYAAVLCVRRYTEIAQWRDAVVERERRAVAALERLRRTVAEDAAKVSRLPVREQQQG